MTSTPARGTGWMMPMFDFTTDSALDSSSGEMCCGRRIRRATSSELAGVPWR